MTRWSLRRRQGAPRDAEREYQPPAPVSGRSSAPQPAAALPVATPPPGPPPGAHPSGPQPFAPHPSGPQPSAGRASGGQPQAAPPPGRWPDHGGGAAGPGPWPDICDQFGLQLLVLSEQLRTSLDELEADEADPERLKRLFQVDHAVTRMRRASRDLRVLAGRGDEETAGFTTSLLDVIRMAASGIERYTQVTLGRVTDLAVLGYAADDVGSLMAALLDNATRYSPGTVSVSCHLLDDGGVMFRIEDTGIGLGADQVAALNAILAGPVPEVDEQTGRHSGFPVVHRLARKHSVGVRLATRPLPGSGTVAMVSLPPHLLCEDPAQAAQRRAAPPSASSRADLPPGRQPTVVNERPAGMGGPSRAEPTRPHQPQQWEQAAGPDRDQPRSPADLPRRPPAGQSAGPPGGLPRRPSAGPAGEPWPSRRHQPGGQPREQPPLTAQQQSAARRGFADDLSAFSRGASLEPRSAEDGASADAVSKEPR
jgi:Histidine kinase-, DNA gyrase B-, and HSP90-like ATPase